jgi:hypothetical protein
MEADLIMLQADLAYDMKMNPIAARAYMKFIRKYPSDGRGSAARYRLVRLGYLDALAGPLKSGQEPDVWMLAESWLRATWKPANEEVQ